MEVRIRLQRAGKSAKKRYNYRVVAIARRKSRQGRHIEILGHYEPAKNPAVFSIDKEKLDKWLKRGAQMTETVHSLVKKQSKTNT